jgi:hypothetical protein
MQNSTRCQSSVQRRLESASARRVTVTSWRKTALVRRSSAVRPCRGIGWPST